MIPLPEKKISNTFNSLRENYISRLKHDLADLVAISTEFNLAELSKKAHGLAGSGTTFGFPGISQKGTVLESACKSQLLQPQINKLLADLIDECELAISHSKKSLDIIQKTVQQSKLINIVSREPKLVYEISSLIRFSNYKIETFNDLLALNSHNLWPALIPEIIIIETDFSLNDTKELKHYLSQFDKDNLPEIFYISSQDNFTTRLKAVQAQGQAYFTKPLNFDLLEEKIQSSIKEMGSQPYHVMIIEDDKILAETFSLILEKAGMKTTVIYDPLQAMEAVSSAPVDLILTDFHLPNCNGLELASILRQYNTYLSIPIMFISSEIHLETILNDAKINIDDFLTKPVKPVELVAKVEKRAARARALRNLMVKDGLTGALNRTKFNEELTVEIENSKKKSSNLTYALIDIDNFKSINDKFGHATGDMVIKSLVKNLKQRLRGSDLIGRYGGDEFAVVLLDTDKASALVVMEQILKKFSSIKYNSNEELSASFSCGIATLEQDDTVKGLAEIADQAMYVAKKEGRGRIVCG